MDWEFLCTLWTLFNAELISNCSSFNFSFCFDRYSVQISFWTGNIISCVFLSQTYFIVSVVDVVNTIVNAFLGVVCPELKPSSCAAVDALAWLILIINSRVLVDEILITARLDADFVARIDLEIRAITFVLVLFANSGSFIVKFATFDAFFAFTTPKLTAVHRRLTLLHRPVVPEEHFLRNC